MAAEASSSFRDSFFSTATLMSRPRLVFIGGMTIAALFWIACVTPGVEQRWDSSLSARVREPDKDAGIEEDAETCCAAGASKKH